MDSGVSQRGQLTQTVKLEGTLAAVLDSTW